MPAIAAPRWPDPARLVEVGARTKNEEAMRNVGLLLADARNPGGRRWFFKGDRALGRKEEAAYQLSLLLGVPAAPAKVVSWKRRAGLLVQVIAGAEELWNRPEWGWDESAAIATEDHIVPFGTWPKDWFVSLVGQMVLEYLIHDTDRHAGNYVVTQARRLVSIDHAYSLDEDEMRRDASVSKYLKDNNFSPLDKALSKGVGFALDAIRPSDVTTALDRLARVPEAELARIVDAATQSSVVLLGAMRRYRSARDGMVELFRNAIDKAPTLDVPPIWQFWRETPAL